MPISLIKEESAHILRVLPILLKKDEQFKSSLYTIFSETFVKKDDFSELKDIVKNLGITVQELALAQKRTEQRVEELVVAQKRTEQRVEELALAQKETQIAVEKLVISQKEIQKEVGSLSQSIGFGLEDIARVVLPGYLKRHLNIDVDGELERRFFYLENNQEIEINLYGEGRQNGKEILIVGESKGRIYKREVEDFINDIKRLEKAMKKPCVKIMFGFFIHPSGQELALKEDILLVASYQK
ncbi:MAG: hypothetical protein AAB267_00400 [Candidatus Desantisbacteria bacterium]